MLVRGFLYDPVKDWMSSFTKEYNDPIERMLDVGSHDLTQILMFPPNPEAQVRGLVLILDEMCLVREDQKFWQLGNYPYPLAGKVLFLGYNEVDEEGKPTSYVDCPVMSAATFKNQIVAIPSDQMGLVQAQMTNGAPLLPMPKVERPTS